MLEFYLRCNKTQNNIALRYHMFNNCYGVTSNKDKSRQFL